MIQNNSTMDSSSICNSNSQEWRVNEARIMFALLQAEYEDSKRLSAPQRYRELQRIISMFTSEQVLEKIKWLSEEDDDEEEEDDAQTDYSEDADSSYSNCADDINGNPDSNIRKDSALFGQNLGAEIRRFVTKMKMLSTFPTLNTSASTNSFLYSSPSASETTSASSPFSSCSNSSSSSLQYFNNYTTSSSSNSSSSNRSAPTTPVSTTKTSEMPTCQSWPLFIQLPLDSNSNFPSYDGDMSTSTANTTVTVYHRQKTTSTSSNETDNSIGNINSNKQHKERSPCHRRSEFDMCIIKKDRIPAFEIPPLRLPTSKSDHIDIDKIVPSLYMSSKPNSPTCDKSFMKFRSTFLSPNIQRSSSLDSDKHSNSSSKGLISKFRQAIRKDYKSEQSFEFNSMSDDSSFSSSSKGFDIQEAHFALTRLKQEFEDLSTWNVLSRYRKMKKMLKIWGKLDLSE